MPRPRLRILLGSVSARPRVIHVLRRSPAPFVHTSSKSLETLLPHMYLATISGRTLRESHRISMCTASHSLAPDFPRQNLSTVSRLSFLETQLINSQLSLGRSKLRILVVYTVKNLSWTSVVRRSVSDAKLTFALMVGCVIRVQKAIPGIPSGPT